MALVAAPRGIRCALFALAVTLLALTLASTAAAQSPPPTPEVEPNNSFADADLNIVRITGDKTISGYLSRTISEFGFFIPADRDFFRVEVSGPAMTEVTLRVSHPSDPFCGTLMRPTMRLYDAARVQLQSAGFTSCPQIRRRLAPGVHYVELDNTGSLDVPDYRLTATYRSPEACSDGLDGDGDGSTDYPADLGCESLTDTTEDSPDATDGRVAEQEPNGTRAEAEARSLRIADDILIAGAIDPAGNDADQFRVELAERSTVRLRVLRAGTTACGGLDMTLSESSGALIEMARGSLPCRNVIEKTLPAGVYYVSLGSSSQGEGIPGYRLEATVDPAAECSDLTDNDGDGRGDYPADPGCDLPTDDSEAPDATDGRVGEEEANNSRADADARSLRVTSGTPIAGEISPAGDKDFFRLDVPRTADVNFAFRHGRSTGCFGTSLRLSLQDSTGATLTAGSIGSECTTSFSRRLAPGTYYLLADVAGGQETMPSYRLTATMANVPFCRDALDNDADAKADFPADPGCETPDDDSEDPDATDGRVGEQEPNNTIAEAGARSLQLTDGALVVGSSSLSDPDWFRFEVTDRTGVSLALRQSDGTCPSNGLDELTIYDAGGTALTSTALMACGTASRTLAAGTYYAKVRTQPARTYRLTAAFGPPAPECSDRLENDVDGRIDYPADLGCDVPSDDSEGSPDATDGRIPEQDPNDSTFDADARPIRVLDDSLIAGSISWAGDWDYYRLDITTPQDVTVKLRDAEGGCTAPADFYVLLPSTAWVGYGFHYPGTCAETTVSLTPGTYYLRVQPAGGAPVPAYRLLTSMRPTPQCKDGLDNDVDGRVDYPRDTGCDQPGDDSESPDATDGRVPEVEPNGSSSDSGTSAVTITGNRLIAGGLSDFSDRDYFRISLTGTRQVTLESRDHTGTGCAGGMATYLTVQNSSGTNVAFDENGGIEDCSRVTVTLGAGTYYVVLDRAQSSPPIDAYRLIATVTTPQCADGVDNDFDGRRDFGSASTNDRGCSSLSDDSESPDPGEVLEQEPNNTPSDASPAPLGMANGLPITGALTPAGDRDFFRIDVPARGTLRLESRDGTANACAGIDTVVRLYDDGGSQLASDDDGGINLCSLLSRDVDPGTYYVSVEEFRAGVTAPAYKLISSLAPFECSDGLDNDQDGKRDYGEASGNDPGCSSGDDTSESPDPGEIVEEEPNNSTGQASARALRLTDGAMITGSIAPVGDRDYYRLDVTATSALEFETRDGTTVACGQGVDTVIRLYNESGIELAVDDQGSTLPGNCSLLKRTVPPGTYFLAVEDWLSNSVINRYRLLTKVTPADAEPPTAAHTVTPDANAAGWHRDDAAVELAAQDEAGGTGVKEIVWSAAGAGASPTTTVPGSSASVPVNAEGETTITYRARDNAGNTSDPRTVTVKLDKTDPSADCADPDNQWHAADQTFPCTAADGDGSGLSDPADASFELSTSVEQGEETDTAQTGSREVCDVAGNCATAGPVGPVKVDRRAPAIAITRPAGDTFTLDDEHAASYDCTDGGSGIDACAGDVANGAALDTSTPGPHTFGVSATDKAGNTASASASYTVAVTPASLCARTTRYVRASSRYAAQSEPGRRAGDAVAAATCNKVDQISESSTPEQKQRAVRTYRLAVQALVAEGWLSAEHGETLAALAGHL